MNLILFEPHETTTALLRSDPRGLHILEVLRRQVGDSFDAGLIDGPRGKATLEGIDADVLRLRFEWGETPDPLEPITLVLGMPRPQTARKVLEEATTMGVEAMHFVATDRGDSGYARSRLWTGGEWRRRLIAGAEQAFSTHLPRLSYDATLSQVIAALPPGGCRLALDNYESARRLGEVAVVAPVILAIGGERGWSEGERGLLRDAGFELVNLGERVLRVETACVAAISLARAGLGHA